MPVFTTLHRQTQIYIYIYIYNWTHRCQNNNPPFVSLPSSSSSGTPSTSYTPPSPPKLKWSITIWCPPKPSNHNDDCWVMNLGQSSSFFIQRKIMAWHLAHLERICSWSNSEAHLLTPTVVLYQTNINAFLLCLLTGFEWREQHWCRGSGSVVGWCLMS